MTTMRVRFLRDHPGVDLHPSRFRRDAELSLPTVFAQSLLEQGVVERINEAPAIVVAPALGDDDVVEELLSATVAELSDGLLSAAEAVDIELALAQESRTSAKRAMETELAGRADR